MPASVRDLILAAQAQQKINPIASVLENFGQGVSHQAFGGDMVSRALQLAKLRQLQDEQARRAIREKEMQTNIRRLERGVSQKKLQKEEKLTPKGLAVTYKPTALPKTLEEVFARQLYSGESTIQDIAKDKAELQKVVASSPQSKNERTKTALTLNERLSNRKEVEDATKVEGNVRAMDSLLDRALAGGMKNKIALEQALITMFNKITDPGSVVRESEFARTPENAPIVNRILGALQKPIGGGTGLTDADREALVIGAKVIANERMKVASRTRQGFVDMADRIQIDPELVTGGIGPFVPFDIPEPRFGVEGQAGSPVLGGGGMRIIGIRRRE